MRRFRLLLAALLPSLHVTNATADETDPTPLAGVRRVVFLGDSVLKLVQKQQRLLKDAWLTRTGHQRPGMKPGLTLEEAERLADALDVEIRALLAPAP